MRCPFCKADDDKVVDTRTTPESHSIRRRRECLSCGRRFTTYERVAPTFVRKRDGRLEPFDPDKIRRGLENALADRPLPTGTVDALVERGEGFARSSTEVSAEEIGRIVLEGLRDVDQVAYLRFASVYKEFQGASDFEREMASLEDPV